MKVWNEHISLLRRVAEYLGPFGTTKGTVLDTLQRDIDAALKPLGVEVMDRCSVISEELVEQAWWSLLNTPHNSGDYPEKAFITFDELREIVAGFVTLAREGRPPSLPSPKPETTPHRYIPHPKWLWFCDECGYPEHDAIKHLPAFTVGHCEENKKPGGCQLHNLQCSYPECDRRPA